MINIPIFFLKNMCRQMVFTKYRRCKGWDRTQNLNLNLQFYIFVFFTPNKCRQIVFRDFHFGSCGLWSQTEKRREPVSTNNSCCEKRSQSYSPTIHPYSLQSGNITPEHADVWLKPHRATPCPLSTILNHQHYIKINKTKILYKKYSK